MPDVFDEFEQKEKISTKQIISVVSFIFIIALLILIRPAITGFSISQQELTSYTQDYYHRTNLSTSITEFTMLNYPDEFELKGMKVSGTYQGTGIYSIYLRDPSFNHYLIATNEPAERGAAISGFLVRDVASVDEPSNEGTSSSDTEELPSQPEDSTSQPSRDIASIPTDTTTETTPTTSQPDTTNTSTESSNSEETIEEEVIEETPAVELPIYTFTEECVETCALVTSLNDTTYELYIELSSGLLTITDVVYILSESTEAPEDVTEETVENVTQEIIVENITVEENITEENITEVINETNETIEYNGTNVTVIPNVLDSKGERVPVTIEFVNPAGKTVASRRIQKERTAGTQSTESLKIPKGKYDMSLTFEDHPVKKIEFDDLTITNNITEFIKVDDPDNGNSAELYAIDPTAFDFESATVTVTATGNTLYKCKEWDFESQFCYGTWTFLQSIKPGEDYTFELTPDDPGFKETVSNCTAEDNEAVKTTFAHACDDPAGSYLEQDEGTVETHAYDKNIFAGVKIQSVDTGITGCTAITKVEICYEWWTTNVGGVPTNCDVSVDINGGGSWSAATTTCPGTTQNPGVICDDVTGAESWNCTNFFGASGTRAEAKSELSRAPSGGGSVETGTWDVLYFNVTYDAEVLNDPPSIVLDKPENNTQFNDTQDINFNFTATDDANTTLNCSIYLDGALNQTNNTAQNNTITNFNITNINYSSHNWFINCTDGTDSNVSETRYFTINDTLPPAKVTGLENQSQGTTWIYWNWTNPTDGDFNHTEVWINGTFYSNVSKPDNFYNATGLDINSWYEIQTKTTDHAGNVNTTWVNDTAKTLPDTTNPVINSINDTPDPVQRYQNITITANVTDDINVSSAWVEINGTNYTLIQGPDNSDLWNRTYNTTPLPDGLYNYTVFANDTSDNPATSVGGNFTVQDPPPATVTGLDNQSQGITWIYWNWTNPTDGDFNHTEVWINGTFYANISKPDNFYNATSLIPNNWYEIQTKTTDHAGNVNTTWVNDTAKTLPDTTNPVINAINDTPDPVQRYQNITITANVTDDINVSSAWVEINGTNYTLIQSQGNSDLWNRTYNTTPLPDGLYNYTVFANDTSDNPATSVGGNFTVQDPPPATVTGLDNQSQGTTWIYWNWTNPTDGDFNHTEVWINGTPYSNVSAPDNFYNATSLTPNNWYEIQTRTVDHAGNINTTWVNDTAKTLAGEVSPVINWINDTPDPVERYQNITITANVTDDIDVSSAWVEINGTNYTLIQGPGNSDLWNRTYNTTSLEAGLYNYTVFANDTSDNSATSVIGNFTVQDPPPAIFDLRPIVGANETTNTSIEIAANVTDNYQVDSVWVNITYPNTTTILLDLNPEVGDKYNNSFSIPENLTGQYNITFFANDTDNNLNDTETTYFNASQPEAIAIALSDTLAGGVLWNISVIPVTEANATGNNNTNTTEYYVEVSANYTNVDVYIRATDNLTSGLNTILLSNEKFSYNISNRTVPFTTKYSITLNFSDNKIADNVPNNTTIWLKFFLNVTGGQAAGTYNNTVEFQAVETGQPP